ncbi:MAG: hypothetical protein QXJ15_04430 [Candidatus Bathyarchaeia archaeon]
MPAPSISFTDTSDNALSSVNYGTVDAGSNSSTITFRIWNNKGGSSSVSDAQECKLTTWDNTSHNSNNNVNGADSKPRPYCKQTYYDTTPVSDSYTNAWGADNKHSLPGNDGVIGGGMGGHYAQVDTYIAVPASASPGQVSFVWTLHYVYV